jgi:hypothetical protein
MDVSVGSSTGTSLGYAPSGRVVRWRLSAFGCPASANIRPERTGCYLALLFTSLPPH